jgi:DNA polymerase-3 subunit beta
VRASIEATRHAVSSDVTRVHLASLYLTPTGAVATDGHRLALYGDPGGGFLVPGKVLPTLLTMLSGSESLTVSNNGNWTTFTVGSSSLIVKQTDAVFPPYRQVIPTEFAGECVVGAVALRDAVRAVRAAACERTSGVRFTIGDNKIRLDTDNNERAGHDEIECTGSGSVVLGLNAAYVDDALGSCGDEVTVKFSGDLDPVMFVSGEFSGCIMPVRI